MTAISQACSDNRAARARRGALSATEWQEYATHLAACADCRVTWSVTIDFEQSAAPAPGDERLLARAAKLALAGSRGRHVHAVRVGAAAAIILLVAGVASGAILLRVRHAGVPVAHSEPPHPARMRARKTAASSAIQSEAAAESGALPAAVPAPAPPAPTAAAEAPPPGGAGPKAVKRAAGHLTALADHSPAPQTSEDAATLFARAVTDREQGRTFAALATFRSLQGRFPGSPQAVLSLVSLADLALDTGDAALALAACEQYLAAAPSGTLVPEALVGSARALTSLGRATEADAVWREIARRFPNSPYVRGSITTGRDTP
jgi:TolA-binding protein